MKFPVLKTAITALGLFTLAACVDPSTQATGVKAKAWGNSYIYSHALYGDPVFDRDVLTFNAAYANKFGKPAKQYGFGYTSSRLVKPTGKAIHQAIDALAKASVDGQDLVVVMMTSHGVPDALAEKTPQQDQAHQVTAATIKDFLEPLNSDKQVIILQACYSGSLIDDLQHPNRIIITAAAADRTSFGCSPKSDNTWFISALNRALKNGGSWRTIFKNTKSLVTADEKANGIGADRQSNPQVYVGRNMKGVWTGAS